LKALIDGDILVYRTGYTTQDAALGIAKWRMDDSIRAILKDLGTEDYEVFLTSSDKSNYRFKLYDKYKANRKSEKPLHYSDLRDHLMAEHAAEMIFGEEADDALGIAQTKDTVICSIDKDLDQIPGNHYNFVKRLSYYVSEAEGLKFFYFQLLRGDPADNIPGCARYRGEESRPCP
jgi:5'-3' exonuclease